MKLEIVTPDGVIFDAEVKQVTLPGSEGEFGVLAKHATLVSLLDTGVIVIEKSDSSEVAVAINSGYVKVDEEKTTCIVDGAAVTLLKHLKQLKRCSRVQNLLMQLLHQQ